MKKLFLLLIAALLLLPGVIQAQADTLSGAEINRIANSVVLVLALDKSGQPYASGSGTVVSANGVIYTNRHVVEGGADFAILTLSDMGEPAVLTYYATPTLIHPDVDFAVLQIDRDKNGNRIKASSLNLPFITLSDTAPGIGDRIFVFGYPSLGDAHMVLTSGSITTIENDTLNGGRIPFWYQTDAQISPGNSGGLVVNTNGQMIGIPTQVRSEDRTLGRLGGILTMTAIRGALESAGVSAQPTQAFVPQPTQPQSNNGNQSGGQQSLDIQIANIEHNVTYNDTLGIKIHTQVTAIGYQGVTLRSAIFFYWDDNSPMPANNRASSNSRTSKGQLTLQQTLTPSYDNSVWDDVWFFLPYDYFPDGRTGSFPAFMEAQLGVDGQDFTAYSKDSSFNYTYPDQQMIVDITSIEHNVTVNNQLGMKVHTHVNTLGYRGQNLRVALFVYWADDTSISGANAPKADRTTSGNLTVQDTLTPSYDNTDWSDFWFFLPYDYFPTGLHGDQQAYAEVELGIDGQDFTSWSLDENFTVNYN